MRLLLVDGNGVNRYTLSKALQRVGYMVAEADSGEAALERYAKGDFDLILSEIALPGISGIELLQGVKKQSQDAIVILVTDEVNVDQAIQALRHGATDLLVKPYSSEDIRECVERGIENARSLRRRRRLLDTIERNVTELAREVSIATVDDGDGAFGSDLAPGRSGTTVRGNVISLGPLAILPGKYQITAGDNAISLTPTEFDLLLYLAANRSRVATCHELVREVRGYQTDEVEAREVIRPHVSNLRRKLRGLGEIDLIVNVRGVGYRLGEIPETD
ncbi:MAG: response regulator transcription factor [Chloroflexi bacterium]|nr:response regulator transcription factor [Chloroflexota bacterium]